MINNDMPKLIECPRDAMQGIKQFIPTQLKADYLNLLLEVGFDTLDFGSFVSPKAIPQLADTSEVLSKLKLENTETKLLAIVANLKGVEQAAKFEHITYQGFPFSISETFQQRNTNSSCEEAFEIVKNAVEITSKNNQELVVYLSMGFGNPYGDEFSVEIVENWALKLRSIGVNVLALSDTIGVSNSTSINTLLESLNQKLSDIEIGVHLHTEPTKWYEKMDSAWKAGCKRFDGALLGFGGCPMAKNDLTGNMATDKIISYFVENKVDININQEKLLDAMVMANRIFTTYH